MNEESQDSVCMHLLDNIGILSIYIVHHIAVVQFKSVRSAHLISLFLITSQLNDNQAMHILISSN